MILSTRTLAVLAAGFALPALAQGPSEGAGFYVGGTLGSAKLKSEAAVALSGAWASESAALRNDVIGMWSKDLDTSGLLGGIQAGYRHPFASGLVLAGELNLAMVNAEERLLTGAVPTPSVPSLTYALDTRVALKRAFSLEAKVGYLFGAHVPFISLGFVNAKAEASSQIISNGGYRKVGQASENASGFQWGLGYEFRFDRTWSAHIAFTSAKLGDLKYDTTYLPGSAFTVPAYGETFTHELTLTTVRLGVNYQF